MTGNDRLYIPSERSQKQLRVKLSCFGVALLLPIILFLVYRKILPVPTDSQMQSSFLTIELNESMLEVKVDSFKTLLVKAYRNGVSIRKQGSNLIVEISGQGTRTPLFYNANPNVLNQPLVDFTIKEDKSKLSINAICKIYESHNIQYIRVPSDVLFKLTDLSIK